MSTTNWAGNLTYGAERFVVAKSVAEAQAAVRGADMLRVVGSHHCFNDIADTTGTQLSLENMTERGVAGHHPPSGHRRRRHPLQRYLPLAA